MCYTIIGSKLEYLFGAVGTRMMRGPDGVQAKLNALPVWNSPGLKDVCLLPWPLFPARLNGIDDPLKARIVMAPGESDTIVHKFIATEGRRPKEQV